MRTERVAEKITQLSPNFLIIIYFNVIKFQRLSQEQLLSNSSRIVRLRDGFDTTGYVPQKKHEDFLKFSNFFTSFIICFPLSVSWWGGDGFRFPLQEESWPCWNTNVWRRWPEEKFTWEKSQPLDKVNDQLRNIIISIERYSSICHDRQNKLTTLSHYWTSQGMLKVAGEHLTMDLNKPLAAPKKDWICEPVRIMGQKPACTSRGNVNCAMRCHRMRREFPLPLAVQCRGMGPLEP